MNPIHLAFSTYFISYLNISYSTSSSTAVLLYQPTMVIAVAATDLAASRCKIKRAVQLHSLVQVNILRAGRYFPNGFFRSGNFPNVQLNPSGNFPKIRLGPLRRHRLQWGQDRLDGRALRLEQAGGRALRLGQTWEVAAQKIAHFGSCYLGKSPWEVSTWKKSFGKVPNIEYIYFIGKFWTAYNT